MRHEIAGHRDTAGPAVIEAHAAQLREQEGDGALEMREILGAARVGLPSRPARYCCIGEMTILLGTSTLLTFRGVNRAGDGASAGWLEADVVASMVDRNGIE
jgi:hypothetical protein